MRLDPSAVPLWKIASGLDGHALAIRGVAHVPRLQRFFRSHERVRELITPWFQTALSDYADAIEARHSKLS